MRVKSHFRDLGSWKLDWRMYTEVEERKRKLTDCVECHMATPGEWVQSSAQNLGKMLVERRVWPEVGLEGAEGWGGS